MLWPPTVSAAVVQVALAALTACAVQPGMAPPLFAKPKPTVPVAALPVTVAVNVTLAPSVDGFAELASAVVVGAGPPPPLLTVWVSVGLVDPVLLASPL